MTGSFITGEGPETKPISKFSRLYRGTYVQANVLGVLVFTQVGIYIALLNLGAGGQASTYTVYFATCITNGLMAILAAPSAFLANRAGLKVTMFIGNIGYTIYSASLYYNSKTGNTSFMMIASVILGISGACFWMAEGAIAMSYPEASFVGMFLGIWQFWFKFGGILAGAIVFSLNKDGKNKGSVGLNTYIYLFSIQCVGPFIVFLLSTPEKVIRRDGTKISLPNKKTPLKQMAKDLWEVLIRKEMLLVIPVCISNHWLSTWNSNFLTHNFSVRARSLNVLLTALIGCAADILGGLFLDCKRISYKTRARSATLFLALSFVAMFIWAFVVQHHVDNNDVGTLDWATGGYYYNAYVPFQFFRVPFELIFVWVYWVSRLYPFTTIQLFYVSGLVRSFESFGGFLAYLVGVTGTSDMNNLIVAGVMYFVSIPFFVYAGYCVTDEAAKKANDLISGVQDEKVVGLVSSLEGLEGGIFDSSDHSSILVQVSDNKPKLN